MKVFVSNKSTGVIFNEHGADNVYEIQLQDDDGLPLDISSNTTTVDLHSTSERVSGSLETSYAVTPGSDTGHGTFEIDAADAFATNESTGTVSYYIWAKTVGGGTTLISSNSLTLKSR